MLQGLTQYVSNNIPKGYSFVGLTSNLENTISVIDSIPATYDWTRTNSTVFKGVLYAEMFTLRMLTVSIGIVCFDFMTSNTKGDPTSTYAQELMLWLQSEGDQLPIGWTSGAVASIESLFGTSWNLYEGVNDSTGITVYSMLPDKQFEGTFTSDLKDWLEALIKLGRFSNLTYINVGNAG